MFPNTWPFIFNLLIILKGLYNKIFTKTDMEKQTTFNKVRNSADLHEMH